MSTEIKHLRALDGWRGASIVFVLLAHLAPLGGWGNLSIGILGMVIFFNLSGFLITSLLLSADATTGDFLIRRFFRVLPLAWLYLSIVFVFQNESMRSWLAHYLFYANLPPPDIRLATDHLWSLCVEVQFYVGVAILFALFGARALVALPLLALVVTLARIEHGAVESTVTWFRIDEILAGCTLALAYRGRLGAPGRWLVALMGKLPQGPMLVLLVLTCVCGLGASDWVAYLRPYVAALTIGATITRSDTRMVRWLDQRWLLWLAGVSYSIYVIHVGLIHTWLGSGDLIEKYAKRPLLLIVVLALAWASTRYFERPLIAVGKRLADRLARWNSIRSVKST
jgi:peptidoglycan/LPS O-acetylase OafA/YrhL